MGDGGREGKCDIKKEGEREVREGKCEIDIEREREVREGRWAMGEEKNRMNERQRVNGRKGKSKGGEGWYQVCSKDRQTDRLGGR